MTEALTRRYKYLDLLINIYVVILIVSNLIAPKFVAVGSFFRFSVAELLFPVTYIFGDIFTEVYGYGASRRAIWYGFIGSGIMTAFGLFAIWLPPAPEFHAQAAYETIFGVVPRNVTGSLLAYVAGEFANSWTLAKMKLWTGGRHLWTRTIGSTIVGELVDTCIVVLFIFWGQSLSVMFQLIVSAYVFKVLYEVVATPATYAVVNFLKRKEHIDFFDRGTDFNPFRLSE